MFDADLIARVRERKLSEISIFADKARSDGSNVGTYIDIIVSLGDDIDACDILLETGGEAEIELDPMDSPEYLDRLSPQELADEEAFDSLKSEPQEESDAVSVLKEEIAICRERIEKLSQELDYSKGNEASLEEEIAALKEELERVSAESSRLRDELKALRPAEEKKPEPAPASKPQLGGYLSRESTEAIRKAREMKSSKIELFLAEAERGAMEKEVCQDIADFLAVDVAICDAILSIDFSEKSSVVEGFRKIVTVLQESKEPEHQDEYVARLTPEEASIEYSYSRVINSLQGMMMYMRSEISSN